MDVVGDVRGSRNAVDNHQLCQLCSASEYTCHSIHTAHTMLKQGSSIFGALRCQLNRRMVATQFNIRIKQLQECAEVALSGGVEKCADRSITTFPDLLHIYAAQTCACSGGKLTCGHRATFNNWGYVTVRQGENIMQHQGQALQRPKCIKHDL